MKTVVHRNLLLPLAVFCGALLTSPAHAGRPLVVDDADVAEAGTGHVEAWYGRLTGRTHTWNVAPVYVVVDGLELGAALTRDTTTPTTGSALQAKWRITPVLEHGCNLGASVGASHASNGGGNATFVNAIGTCNSDFGALHLNLGGNRASHGPTLGTWGVAVERAFDRITANLEAFGQRRSKPGFQAGLRTDIAPGLQIDGSIGRQERDTLFSVGFKKIY